MISRTSFIAAAAIAGLCACLGARQADARTMRPDAAAFINTMRPVPAHAAGAPGDSLARARAIEGARRLHEATLESDDDVCLELTLPKLIAIVGGREKYLEVLHKGMREIHKAGLMIAGYTISDTIQLQRHVSEVYAVIPTVLTLTSENNGRVTMESYLIGFSSDSGKTWAYVNGSEQFSDRSKLKLLFPHMPNSFKLPESKPPVVQR